MRKPEWLKIKLQTDERFKEVSSLVKDLELHTVCREAHCPNIFECFRNGTATFLILGPKCTRSCRFCAIDTGSPDPVDRDEPARIAKAVSLLKLKHAVITSVTRDDLETGGAEIFALTIERIRAESAGCTVEVLIPDFKGDESSLLKVLSSRPDILNHNIETVPRLYPAVRPDADYNRSLEVLSRSAGYSEVGILTKSGIMIGLGENIGEIIETMKDMVSAGCGLLTIGQYLSPSKEKLTVQKYYTPDEFRELKEKGLSVGFEHVESGPLVRSSYHAEKQLSETRDPE
jgi:lipoic acid synthetase